MWPGTAGGNQDGCVTREEFFGRFCELATQYPNDDTFNTMMEKVWKVSEDPDAPLDNTRVMHLLGLMRQRIITLANSKQESYFLRDLFRTYDTNNSGNLGINEVAGLLSALGVAVQEHELVAMFKLLDTSKNGVLEYEEFQTFVDVDRYTKFKF
jgi:Ca2+-binding EF-hand superfamily protein